MPQKINKKVVFTKKKRATASPFDADADPIAINK